MSSAVFMAIRAWTVSKDFSTQEMEGSLKEHRFFNL